MIDQNLHSTKFNLNFRVWYETEDRGNWKVNGIEQGNEKEWGLGNG